MVCASSQVPSQPTYETAELGSGKTGSSSSEKRKRYGSTTCTRSRRCYLCSSRLCRLQRRGWRRYGAAFHHGNGASKSIFNPAGRCKRRIGIIYVFSAVSAHRKFRSQNEVHLTIDSVGDCYSPLGQREPARREPQHDDQHWRDATGLHADRRTSVVRSLDANPAGKRSLFRNGVHRPQWIRKHGRNGDGPLNGLCECSQPRNPYTFRYDRKHLSLFATTRGLRRMRQPVYVRAFVGDNAIAGVGYSDCFGLRRQSDHSSGHVQHTDHGSRKWKSDRRSAALAKRNYANLERAGKWAGGSSNRESTRYSGFRFSYDFRYR